MTEETNGTTVTNSPGPITRSQDTETTTTPVSDVSESTESKAQAENQVTELTQEQIELAIKDFKSHEVGTHLYTALSQKLSSIGGTMPFDEWITRSALGKDFIQLLVNNIRNKTGSADIDLGVLEVEIEKLYRKAHIDKAAEIVANTLMKDQTVKDTLKKFGEYYIEFQEVLKSNPDTLEKFGEHGMEYQESLKSNPDPKDCEAQITKLARNMKQNSEKIYALVKELLNSHFKFYKDDVLQELSKLATKIICADEQILDYLYTEYPIFMYEQSKLNTWIILEFCLARAKMDQVIKWNRQSDAYYSELNEQFNEQAMKNQKT